MDLEAFGFFLSNVLLLGVAYVGLLQSIVLSGLFGSWLSAEYLFYFIDSESSWVGKLKIRQIQVLGKSTRQINNTGYEWYISS